MSKTIVTFQEVIELNQRLLEKGLNFQLHLRDACGGQSFELEPLNACSCEGRYEEMREEVTAYFSSKGISIQFLADQLHFIIS